MTAAVTVIVRGIVMDPKMKMQSCSSLTFWHRPRPQPRNQHFVSAATFRASWHFPLQMQGPEAQAEPCASLTSLICVCDCPSRSGLRPLLVYNQGTMKTTISLSTIIDVLNRKKCKTVYPSRQSSARAGS